jgi:hypothetical protein
MVRVCGTCRGSGLARYRLHRLKHLKWLRSVDGSLSPQDRKTLHCRLCRTCGGMGVEGLEEVERVDNARRVAWAAFLRERATSRRLRAELHDLAESSGKYLKG